jgi:hypothetical protein
MIHYGPFKFILWLTLMPLTAPPTVFTPPGIPTPAAPGAVFNPPGIPTPSAPCRVYFPPVRGGGDDSMTIGGTLTSDGSTPLVFPDLIYAGEYNGYPIWTASGEIDTLFTPALYWDSGYWTLRSDSPYCYWETSSVTQYPQNLDWSGAAVTGCTGTPVFTFDNIESVPAFGELVINGGTTGQVMTIGGRAYTLTNTASPTAPDTIYCPSAGMTKAINIAAALNGTADSTVVAPGTAANAAVAAAAVGFSVELTARTAGAAGNSIATSITAGAPGAAFPNATLHGGADASIAPPPTIHTPPGIPAPSAPPSIFTP